MKIIKTPYLDEMINELDGYIGSSDNYLSKKGNEKLTELKAIKKQILLNSDKFKIMNFDKEIEDFATRFRLVKAMHEYDMDTLRFRLKMFANDIRRKSQSESHGK